MKKAPLNPQSLAQFAQELYQVLAEEERSENIGLAYTLSGEPKIDSIALVSQTVQSNQSQLKKNFQIHSPIFANAPKPQAHSSLKMPANFRCTLCAGRLYPVRNFFRAGTGTESGNEKESRKLPVLILYHNGPFNLANRPQPIKRDQSENFIFGGEKEDHLFLRICTKLGYSMDSFYYQEYPACHFDAERSGLDDWDNRAKNCMEHVETTIEKYVITKVILCGSAAPAVLGEAAAQEKASASFFRQVFGEKELDCVVLRSPSALLALEKKRRNESRPEVQKNLLEKEKRIKKNMLESLKALLPPPPVHSGHV